MATKQHPTAYTWVTGNDVPSPTVTDYPGNPEDPENQDEEELEEGAGDDAPPAYPDSTGLLGLDNLDEDGEDEDEPEPEPEPEPKPRRGRAAAAPEEEPAPAE